jgi:hypothetical protein
MKKILVLLLAILPIVAFSKKKPVDKLLPMFKKAMKQEKQANGYYLVTDISGKGLAGHSGDDIAKGNAISVSDFFEWAESNLFVIMDYTIETWGDTRSKTWDDKSDYVKSSYFLHENDPVLVQKRLKSIKNGEEIKKEGLSGSREIKVAYDKFKLSDSPDFSQLKNKGSVILVGANRRLGTIVAKVDDILWSGNIDNGFIDGTGFGIFKMTDKKNVPAILGLSSASFTGNVENVYIFLSGTFKHGLVSSKSIFRGFGKNSSNNKISSAEISSPDVYDLTVYWQKTNDRTILDKIDAYRRDRLDEDLPRLESAYNDALKYANNKSIDIEADPSVDRFIRCYNGLDDKGKMKLAKEISGFYSLCDAMKLQPSSTYYSKDHNIFGEFNGYYSWHANRVSHERTIMRKAFETLSKKSQYGFEPFCNYCRPKLEEKNNAIETKITKEWNWYSDWKERKSRELDKKISLQNEEADAIEKGNKPIPQIEKISRDRNFEIITWKDGIMGLLFWDEKGWYVDQGFFGSKYYYKTYHNAVKALYLYKKYNRTSNDGLN